MTVSEKRIRRVGTREAEDAADAARCGVVEGGSVVSGKVGLSVHGFCSDLE